MPLFVAGPVRGYPDMHLDLIDVSAALRAAGYIALCAATYMPTFGSLDNDDARAAYSRRCLAAFAEQSTALALCAGWSRDSTARSLAAVAAHLGAPCFRASVGGEGTPLLTGIDTMLAAEPGFVRTLFDTDPAFVASPAAVAEAHRVPVTAPPPDEAVALLHALVNGLRGALDAVAAQSAAQQEAQM